MQIMIYFKNFFCVTKGFHALLISLSMWRGILHLWLWIVYGYCNYDLSVLYMCVLGVVITHMYRFSPELGGACVRVLDTFVAIIGLFIGNISSQLSISKIEPLKKSLNHNEVSLPVFLCILKPQRTNISKRRQPRKAWNKGKWEEPQQTK